MYNWKNELTFSPAITARLHGLAGVSLHRGSTPDFCIWEQGDTWGHLGPGYATRYNPEQGRHVRLPEDPVARRELNEFIANQCRP